MTADRFDEEARELLFFMFTSPSDSDVERVSEALRATAKRAREDAFEEAGALALDSANMFRGAHVNAGEVAADIWHRIRERAKGAK